jgi:hypothetical protein
MARLSQAARPGRGSLGQEDLRAGSQDVLGVLADGAADVGRRPDVGDESG